MMVALVITVWIILGTLAYLIHRGIWKRDFNEWTISDRRLALIVACGGPFALFGEVILYLILLLESDKPAKW